MERYLEPLTSLIGLSDRLHKLHPYLRKLFPIVIVEAGYFYLFDLDEAHRAYELKLSIPAPMPTPEGVRASFPLDFYGNRPACVVTGDVFDSLEGYVTTFHEFVHCQQFETCEMKLKETLAVYRRAQQRGDFMWEIMHPFPYDNAAFIASFRSYRRALEGGDETTVMSDRQALKAALAQVDWEYLAWQEWKEGLARWLENKARRSLNLAENHGGADEPFSRVSFYESGDRLIEILDRNRPNLTFEVATLFEVMR